MSDKYIIYKCSVCLRETEVILDGRRPDPVRCNITLNCRGKLARVGERAVREFLFTPLVPGLPDYIPRGTEIIPAPQITVPNPITVFTSAGDGIMTLAAIHRTVTGANSEFYVIDTDGNPFTIESQSIGYLLPQTSSIRMVIFEVSPELLTANKFIYSINGPVQMVTGKDDSPEGVSLRFNSSNQVAVYANGIKLEDSQFDRSVDDQVTFTPAIYDSNNVIEVFVYKDISVAIDSSKQITLQFKVLKASVPADRELLMLNTWGNVGGCVINNVERLNLYCTDLSQLNPDKSYGVSHFETTSTITGETRKIKTDDVFILLGREPFSFVDKELYAYLSGSALVDDQSILLYKQSHASGSLFLSIDDSIITQVFNPIKLTKRTITTANISNSGAVITTPLEGTENLHRKYILGPV